MKSFLGKFWPILPVLLTILVFANAWAENWKSFYSINRQTFYYDLDSISLTSKNVVRVRCQRVYAPAGMGTAGARIIYPFIEKSLKRG